MNNIIYQVNKEKNSLRFSNEELNTLSKYIKLDDTIEKKLIVFNELYKENILNNISDEAVKVVNQAIDSGIDTNKIKYLIKYSRNISKMKSVFKALYNKMTIEQIDQIAPKLPENILEIALKDLSNDLDIDDILIYAKNNFSFEKSMQIREAILNQVNRLYYNDLVDINYNENDLKLIRSAIEHTNINPAHFQILKKLINDKDRFKFFLDFFIQYPEKEIMEEERFSLLFSYNEEFNKNNSIEKLKRLKVALYDYGVNYTDVLELNKAELSEDVYHIYLRMLELNLFDNDFEKILKENTQINQVLEVFDNKRIKKLKEKEDHYD